MNNNEPIILGKVKKGKTGKPILALIIFLFIGAFLLYLPSIINYFGDYSIIELVKKGEIVDFLKNHNSYINNNIKVKQEETNIQKNLINPKTSIKYNSLTLSNFILKKESLEYDITSSEEINLDNQQLFLFLTQDDNEIITIKLEGIIKEKQTIKFNFINSLNSTINIYGEIKSIKQKDYPDYLLNSDESGIASLTCIKKTDKIEYIFNLNNLISLNEIYTYKDNDTNNYLSEFDKYAKLKNQIINTNNISELIEDNTGFTFKSNIDLTIFNELINNYYKINTQPKIIFYEMTSKGYDCK